MLFLTLHRMLERQSVFHSLQLSSSHDNHEFYAISPFLTLVGDQHAMFAERLTLLPSFGKEPTFYTSMILALCAEAPDKDFSINQNAVTSVKLGQSVIAMNPPLSTQVVLEVNEIFQLMNVAWKNIQIIYTFHNF
jgi:hypothetical protein